MKVVALVLLGLVIGFDFASRNITPIVETKVEYRYHKPRVSKLTVTAYSLRHKECDNDLKHTALMRKPIPGFTAAISRDNLHLLGKKVYVEGYGVWKVTDVMNERYSNRIDLLMPTKEAEKFNPVTAIVAVVD